MKTKENKIKDASIAYAISILKGKFGNTLEGELHPDVLVELSRAYEAGHKDAQPKWIKCSERMPEVGDDIFYRHTRGKNGPAYCGGVVVRGLQGALYVNYYEFSQWISPAGKWLPVPKLEDE
jgi:hypothetical protein